MEPVKQKTDNFACSFCWTQLLAVRSVYIKTQQQKNEIEPKVFVTILVFFDFLNADLIPTFKFPE